MFLRSLVVIFIFLTSLSCGSNTGAVLGLLCGIGHQQSALTVGLNLEELVGLGLIQDPAISNDQVKEFLNTNLESVVSQDTLRVKTVDTAMPDDDTDNVRFLELDGTFAGGFGFASSFLIDAFTGTNLQSSSVFEFINDSFQIHAATSYIARDTRLNHNDWKHSWQPLSGLSALTQDIAPDQWALKQTEYAAALEHLETIGQSASANAKDEVIVAVLDTGVDLQHPDLVDILVDGYDAVDSGVGADDENGHGTHCAGIIAS